MNFDGLLEIRHHLRDAIDKIDEDLIQMDWRHLANRGESLLAIKSYRREHNCGLMEARDMVRSFCDMLGTNCI